MRAEFGRAARMRTDVGPARIDIAADHGWSRHRAGDLALWFKGHLFGRDPAALARELAAIGPDLSRLEQLVAALDGHFALAAEGPGWALAAVDRIRSVPLCFAFDGAQWVVGADAPALRDRLGLCDIDRDQALALGMAGFCLAGRTIYRGLEELKCGELALFAADGTRQRRRYHVYRPWQTKAARQERLARHLGEVTLGVFEKMVASLDGRMAVVPLSAGLDSRLVAAALKRLGHGNVRCFSYGLPGNYEAEASRRIAEHLGFAWTFVPLSLRAQRSFFAGQLSRDYMRIADSLAAVPFHLDLYPVARLVDSGFIPADAVIVNGQSGDFITGNHIPRGLHPDGGISSGALYPALIDKHYSLWRALETPENLRRVTRLLQAEIAEDGAAMAPEWALFELSEYQNRQAKYVVSNQRIYEFFGLDWRLPLWDRDFVDFWQGVPLEHKAGQRLYRAVLDELDLGGVWRGWEFPRRVSPGWIRPLRNVAKLAHAPFGPAAWHRFERNWLAYPTDIIANYAIAPYTEVRRDRRGHRNAISWHAEAYLRNMGMALDGSPLTAVDAA